MLQLIQINFNGVHLLCLYLFVQNMFEVGISYFNKVLTRAFLKVIPKLFGSGVYVMFGIKTAIVCYPDKKKNQM